MTQKLRMDRFIKAPASRHHLRLAIRTPLAPQREQLAAARGVHRVPTRRQHHQNIPFRRLHETNRAPHVPVCGVVEKHKRQGVHNRGRECGAHVLQLAQSLVRQRRVRGGARRPRGQTAPAGGRTRRERGERQRQRERQFSLLVVSRLQDDTAVRRATPEVPSGRGGRRRRAGEAALVFFFVRQRFRLLAGARCEPQSERSRTALCVLAHRAKSVACRDFQNQALAACRSRAQPCL